MSTWLTFHCPVLQQIAGSSHWPIPPTFYQTCHTAISTNEQFKTSTKHIQISGTLPKQLHSHIYGRSAYWKFQRNIHPDGLLTTTYLIPYAEFDRHFKGGIKLYARLLVDLIVKN